MFGVGQGTNRFDRASGRLLFRKPQALIPEALDSYFGSGRRLFRKRWALIREAPCAAEGYGQRGKGIKNVPLG